MIAGEYAILHGRCRALAVAVGELARCVLGGPRTVPLLKVHAFGEVWRYPLTDLPDTGMQGVLRAVFRAADARGLGLRHDLELALSGHVGGVKVGLGTSAAAVVAALGACVRSAGAPLKPLEFEALAQAIHHEVQGNKGSGYDIGTIAAGGCVAYDATTRTAEQLAWPPGLHGAALFTGVAADTRAAIDQPPTAACLGEMAAGAQLLETAWRGADIPSILAGLQACQRAFDAAAKDQPALMTDALRRALNTIADNGCVGRVSGAGGGDCTLAFAGSESAITCLTDRWQAAGRHVVARLPADMHMPGSAT